MTLMGTHKRNLRHASPDAATRNYPWPLLFIAAPAAVAIWSGWVGLGGLCGFGPIHPLPGIADSFTINTAITLPVGVEAYGAYALRVWLTAAGSDRVQRFAKASAFGALALGMCGQVIYHLLVAAGATRAPWPVVVLVSCLPVATLGCGAALAHLLRADDAGAVEQDAEETAQETERAALRVALEAEQAARETAEAGRETAEAKAAEAAAEAGNLTRKLAAIQAQERTRKPRPKTAAAPRRKTAASPATQVPKDVDVQAEALAVIAAEPDISGADLGERVGRSERWGQTFKKNLATAGTLNGHAPEE
jgi:hypothetical protein